MSTFQDRITLAFNKERERRMGEKGKRLTYTELWKAAGASSAAATHWFDGSNGADLATCFLIAPVLHCNPKWLYDESQNFDEPIREIHGHAVGELAPLTQVATGTVTSKLPVVGTAQLGDNGHWYEMDAPVGHGDGYVRHSTGDANAYAVRCRGDSMKPRIKHGEYVIVEPNHAPCPGDEVLVRSRDGRVMVKEWLYTRDGLVHLLSINEDHPKITIPVEEIEVMHYVAAISKQTQWVPE